MTSVTLPLSRVDTVRPSEKLRLVDRFLLVLGLLISGLFLAVDQLPAAPFETVEGRRRRMAIEPLSEECLPVVRRNRVEGRHDIVEGVSDDLVAFVLDAEKGAREIIEGAPVVRQLAQLGVDVEPQEHPLVVVIHGALPAREGQRPAAEDRLIGRVLQIAPQASRPVALVDRRDVGKRILRHLLRPEPGPGGQRDAPVLRLALIHPKQGVLHRYIEVGRPQIGRPAILAVPGVRQLMRQQIASRRMADPSR